MAGAINFAMTDIYGGFAGTTEDTIPEANDQKAIVDDQKSAAQYQDTQKKPFPVLLALGLVLIVAVVIGGLS